MPTLPEIDDMLTIVPRLFSRITAAALRSPFQVPFRCTAMTWSNWSSVILRIVASRVMPALLIMMSSAPNWSSAAPISASTSSPDVTSQRTATAILSPPSFSAAACVASRFTSPSTTRAPSSTKRSAMARPRPWAPPVTTAILPANNVTIWSSCRASPSRHRRTSYFIYDRAEPTIGGGLAPRCGEVLSMPPAAVDDDDFQQILAQTRQFVRTAVMPREQEILANDEGPDDLRKQAQEMGLFGYAIPQEWGGLGLDITQDVELAMELGYTSLALRSMFGTNNGIAGQVLVRFGTDEQKTQWLERIAAGDVVASFALTEPGAGSNPAGLRTSAVRDGDGDGWVIDGQKRFITNAPLADLFVVFARTRPAGSGRTR